MAYCSTETGNNDPKTEYLRSVESLFGSDTVWMQVPENNFHIKFPVEKICLAISNQNLGELK